MKERAITPFEYPDDGDLSEDDLFAAMGTALKESFYFVAGDSDPKTVGLRTLAAVWVVAPDALGNAFPSSTLAALWVQRLDPFALCHGVPLRHQSACAAFGGDAHSNEPCSMPSYTCFCPPGGDSVGGLGSDGATLTKFSIAAISAFHSASFPLRAMRA